MELVIDLKGMFDPIDKGVVEEAAGTSKFKVPSDEVDALRMADTDKGGW